MEYQNLKITVRGVLVEGIFRVGGETTGWEVRLDVPITFEGHSLTAVEVNGDTTRFTGLENKYIEMTGQMTLRFGIERQFWPVLEVEMFREIMPRAGDN